MSIKSSISEELQRSPIASISGVTGVLVAVASFVLALLQSGSAAVSSGPLTTGGTHPGQTFVLGNVLLVVAYFLAITITAAMALRLIGRRHRGAAIFASVPLVALTNFSTIVLIFIIPPRAFSPTLFASAHDLILYASVLIFGAFFGQAVIVSFQDFDASARPPREGKDESKGRVSDGALFAILFSVILWIWLVSSGQARLVRTFLPEAAHPEEVKPAKGNP